MNLSLSEQLESFVEERAAAGGYASADAYVRELVQKEHDRERLRALILEGANSPLGPEVNDAFFEDLHRRIDRLAGQ